MSSICKQNEKSDEVEIQEVHYNSVSHASKSFNKMSYLFITNQLTDVTVKAGNTLLNVHKLVLASVSEYFLAMFGSDLLESKAKVVELHEVDGQAFKALVSFAYTGSIDIKEDTVESILAAAVLLQFPEVVDACTNFVTKQLDASNCIGIAMFAELRNCYQLRDVAIAYTEEHMEEVMNHEEFLLMPLDDMIRLISRDTINVPSEITIYKGVMNWVEYDVENRSQYLEKLLGYVKLPLLPPDFLVDEVVPKVGGYCTAMIIEALSYQALTQRRTQFPASRVTPRKSTIGSLYFVAGCERIEGIVNYSTTIKEYSPRQNSWSLVAKKFSRRLQLGVGGLGHRLFMIGGRDGLKTVDTAEFFDLNSKLWVDIAPMSSARHALGVVAWESSGPLYAVGGHDGWSYLNTVEQWDPGTGGWSNVKPMTSPRSTIGVSLLRNRLYVVGGRNGVTCLDSLEAYDPLSGKWAICCPMSKRRGGVVSVVLDGLLYAIGGYDVPQSNTATRFSCVERYDARADCWQSVCPMSVGRDSVGAAVLGNKIFAVGGYGGESFLNLVEEYDPFTDTWRQMKSLNMPRAGSCIVYKR